ncbi:MAG: cysteine desulfurase [Bacteroidales bacterium]|nr:cysteine desulfurase [Bacteroidales bacterium]
MTPEQQQQFRESFPILKRQVHDKPLVYLDNAATTQKPEAVLRAVEEYYRETNSNVHRGVHHLSQLATEAYEQARKTVQQFLNARHPHEIVFTRGTTEAINLVAHGFGKSILQDGDEIICSIMEHHSNIVPWQLTGAGKSPNIRVIPMHENGELDLEAYERLFSGKTKIVAVTQASNVLGTITPLKEIIRIAHSHGVPVLVDGAQGVKSCITDVQELDCDFYCFSGHKIYAPMGIGVLYGKEKMLEALPPYQGGGDMIRHVGFDRTTFNDLPFKFEAGTPNVAGAIGLQAALEFVRQYGHENLIKYESELTAYATQRLMQEDRIRIIGNAPEKAAVISFLMEPHHPTDVGTLIDFMGIAVRTGHHCCQPLMDSLGIPGTVRASFAAYNTKEEIDRLIESLRTARKMLG